MPRSRGVNEDRGWEAPRKDDVDKVGGQTPRGRDAEARQRKSRLWALLGLTNERGPTCFVCGQQKRWRAQESIR